ncbi:MAG: hypothetical protein J0L66_10560 [Cytophagales bacterium]|nr:hypothetical protein [Cytophagales bacterium]
MKKSLGLLLILFTISCSNNSDPDPVYSSLVGKWKFATTTVPITGTFEISEFSGELTIDNAFGDFKLNGTTYKIDTRHKMEKGTTPGSFSRFWLINTAQDKEVAFDDSEYSNDFKTITAKKFYYREGNNVSNLYTETIVITRF